MGDIKSIYRVLLDTNEYDITASFEYSNPEIDTKPDNADFVITSHNNPQYLHGARNIHIQHGYGVGGRMLHETDEQYQRDYCRQYYALGLYGEDQKNNHVKRGFDEEKIMLLGMPVSVHMLEKIIPEERAEWLTSKGLDPDKRTIIFPASWNNGSERGLFHLWWEDGKEIDRVYKLCEYITDELNCNFIIRLHERHRYTQDWIRAYRKIFKMYGVLALYLNDDPDIMPYLRYSDQAIGDVSNSNSYFLVMDKPITYIGDGILPKWGDKQGGWKIEHRAGRTANTFEELLECITADYNNPQEYSTERKIAVMENVSRVGEDSREAIVSEFRRITNL